MAIRIGVVVVIALLLGWAVYLVLLRSPVEAPSSVQAGVTIECAAWAGVTAERCGSWGDAVLAAGPPSRTFNMTDLDRLALRRTGFGFGGCEAAYYLGRNPNSPVWEEEFDCPTE